MQVLFKQWCLNEAEHGRSLTVNPADVTSTQFFHPAYEPRWPGDPAMPQATRVILRKGKEYIVQGSVEEVQRALNEREAATGE